VAEQSAYECVRNCIRLQQNSDGPKMTCRERSRSAVARFEAWLGAAADIVLNRAALAFVVALALLILIPLPASQTKSSLSMSVQSGQVSSATITSVAASRPEQPGLWFRTVERLSERLPLVLALTGVVSVLKFLQSVMRGQSRYLTQDIVVEAARPGSGRLCLTTVVENKLEDDETIHNALLLIGHESRSPESILEALEVNAPVQERIRCGRRLQTWAMQADLRQNGRWSNVGYYEAQPDADKERIDCLLRACPLPGRFEAGEGLGYCSVEPILFYMTENDDISNERITFPVSLETGKFAAGQMYIARFYLIGEEHYSFGDAASRCTAKGFVLAAGDGAAAASASA
jgi:hypothetical protein